MLGLPAVRAPAKECPVKSLAALAIARDVSNRFCANASSSRRRGRRHDGRGHRQACARPGVGHDRRGVAGEDLARSAEAQRRRDDGGDREAQGSRAAADAIRTTAYDLQPEFDYANGRQTLRGYVARNAIEVRVDELPKLGDVLDVAVGAGATSVGGVRFDLKDRTGPNGRRCSMRSRMRAPRADAAAAGAGMKVDRVVRIEEQRDGVMPPPRPVMAMRAEAQRAETPVVPASSRFAPRSR